MIKHFFFATKFYKRCKNYLDVLYCQFLNKLQYEIVDFRVYMKYIHLYEIYTVLVCAMVRYAYINYQSMPMHFIHGIY